MNKNVLITGGAGFVGSNLSEKLLSLGYSVVIVDNLSSGLEKNVNKKCKFYKVSVSDKKEINKIITTEKPIYIFHLAANPKIADLQKNPVNEANEIISGLSNLITNMRPGNIKKFIFFSSAAVYSEDNILPLTENSVINPTSFYGTYKFIAENFIKVLCRQKGIPYVILRPANIYGPFQKSNGEGGVVASFIGDIDNHKPLTIYGNGEKTRDFVYVEDVINACILSLTNKINGTFNIGTAQQISIKDLAKEILKITSSKSVIKYSNNREGEVVKSALNFQKISSYGWCPQTNLELGLIETCRWFKVI